MVAMLVYLAKEDGQNSFVKEHQHGGYDVKCIRSVKTRVKVHLILHLIALEICLLTFMNSELLITRHLQSESTNERT